jgi:hypothetical protein
MSTLQIVVFSVIGAVLLVAAGIFLSGKGLVLIPGYKNLPEEEKEKYNADALCRFIGVILLVSTVIIAATLIGYWAYSSKIVLFIGIGADLLITLILIIYAGTGDRFVKKQ